MKLYNLVIVLNREKNKVLMLYRSKDPYKGLYNLPGGKIEKNEDYLESAYRELFEETGINKDNINLIPFMDFKWHTLENEMKVYIGRLHTNVSLIEEIHKLYWISIDENFFNMNKFAGEGNIGHMMEIYFQNKNIID